MTKQELIKLRYSQEHINIRKKEIDILREQIEYINGIDYSKDKTGNSKITQEDLICNLIEQERKLMQDIKALEERKTIAKKLIYMLKNESHQIVLFKRYILCETWEKIAKDINYSQAHIYKIHGWALKELSKI